MSSQLFFHNYISTLSGDDLKRYELKVRLCGEDPYEMCVDFGDHSASDVVPDVCRMDVFDFLVLKTDFYTKEQLKNYKSLESHNYITSGHVKGFRTRSLGRDKAIAFGKVTHSQSLNEPAVRCWILLRMNGEVLSGHCSCMAGTGEVCSHVGAILFYLELAAGKKRETTCTSQVNQWLPPSQNSAPMRTIQDCDLRGAGRKWRDLSAGIQVSSGVSRPKRPRPEAAAAEVDELLTKVKNQGFDSAILKVWPGFQETQDSTTPVTLPPPFCRLFDEKFANLDFSEIRSHCEQVFTTITITKEEAMQLEIHTRQQAKNKIWMEQRAGRITASHMKDVCRTDPLSPSVSLIKRICYPAACTFSTVHTRRGISDEPLILEEFSKIVIERELHHNFELVQCGLIVNQRYPFLGASPDALFSCTCHGGGVVEVKSISVDSKQNTGLQNGLLDRNHKFAYQIQTQMLVCNLPLGYFVEKKPNGALHIEQITPDREIRDEILARAIPFFKLALLPELVCKYFSSEAHILAALDVSQNSRSNMNICICQKPPEAPMINCIGQNCSVITFHKKCVGISRNFKKWTCPNCSKPKALRQKN